GSDVQDRRRDGGPLRRDGRSPYGVGHGEATREGLEGTISERPHRGRPSPREGKVPALISSLDDFREEVRIQVAAGDHCDDRGPRRPPGPRPPGPEARVL